MNLETITSYKGSLVAFERLIRLRVDECRLYGVIGLEPGRVEGFMISHKAACRFQRDPYEYDRLTENPTASVFSSRHQHNTFLSLLLLLLLPPYIEFTLNSMLFHSEWARVQHIYIYIYIRSINIERENSYKTLVTNQRYFFYL